MKTTKSMFSLLLGATIILFALNFQSCKKDSATGPTCPTYELNKIDTKPGLGGEIDPHLQSILDNAPSATPNFSGHFVITTAGCGTECGYPVLYDQTDSTIYSFDQNMLKGALDDSDKPAGSGIVPYIGCSNLSEKMVLHKRDTYGSVVPQYYILTGTTFTLQCQ